jgi:predicted O-linked N-acetylglucosamine transferase (SPINDLY family)
MDSAVVTPTSAAASAAGEPDLDTLLATARQGQMAIDVVMGHAQALQNSGAGESAVRLYETWVAHTESPVRHVACFNCGTMLSSLGRNDDAEAAYKQALAFHANFPPALLNLGHLLERRGDPEGALARWRDVIQATESLHASVFDFRLHAINNSARLLETLKRYPEAEVLMRQSLLLRSTQFDVIQHYVHIRQRQCEWPLYETLGEVTPNQLLLGTSPLAMMSVTDDPAVQLLSAQRFVHERVPKPPAQPLYKAMPAGHRNGRIKLGYLSGDLHHHAVGLLTAELFELHDRSRFEIYAFCWTAESNSPQRQRLLKAMDHHVRLAGVDDVTAAKLIAQAGIDVLVDLQGITNGARPAILGHRAAPVQVSYLGLPGTSALPGVDWIVADRFVMPESLLPYCTEQPIYLPHCYQVSDRKRDIAAPAQRAACQLPEDAFVFGSFNNTFKFTEEIFDAWMRILKQVPNSVLWLLADNEPARLNMLQRAESHGVARERLIFAGRVSPQDYLARFALVDLMLDTFPYNAGTTASDALWMGTPMVTLAGRSYISRMAGSLLTAVGLPELITETLADYERLAVTIGRQPLRAQSYRRYLEDGGRRSPLFDVPQIVRDLEAEFERLALAHRS